MSLGYPNNGIHFNIESPDNYFYLHWKYGEQSFVCQSLTAGIVIVLEDEVIS